MGMMPAKIELNLLPAMADDAPDVIDDIMAEIGIATLASAQAFLDMRVYSRPPRLSSSGKVLKESTLTGALGNSGYVVTSSSSGALAAEAAAKALSPDVRFGTSVGSVRKGEVLVVFAVEYAGYVDQGTVRMAPRHFLTDALNETNGWAEAFVAGRLRQHYG
jgi:hypothetical protein